MEQKRKPYVTPTVTLIATEEGYTKEYLKQRQIELQAKIKLLRAIQVESGRPK